VQEGATNHLHVDGPQQIKKPLQSVTFPIDVIPIFVQDKQVGALQSQLLAPQASLFFASNCSVNFHLPVGTVLVHKVSLHEQQISQQGHAQKLQRHPKFKG
jgi:hypothetical protein